MATDSRELRMRLRSCIDSILDLEEGFRRRGQERFLGPEFAMLRAYAVKTGGLAVDEPTVAHLEALTATILSEYGSASGPMGSARAQMVQ